MDKLDKEIYDNYISVHRNFERKKKKNKIISFYDKFVFHKYFNNKSDISVLDLGSGMGEFSKVCQYYEIKEYLGVDISNEQIDHCQSLYPSYPFIKAEALEFLKQNNSKYNFIYSGHIFEHFNLTEQKKFINLIMKSLKPDGIWINIMINSSAYFNDGGCWGDITHKFVHNAVSFNQLLRNCGVDQINIVHSNSPVGNNIFQHFIHKIFIFFFHIVVRLAGYNQQEIYSLHIITRIQNKNSNGQLIYHKIKPDIK